MTYSGPCYSPSRGGTQDMQRCPRLFDLKRRWEDPRGWSPDIAMGNIVHAGLAAYFYPGDPILSLQTAMLAAVEKEWTGEGQGEAFDLAVKCAHEAIELDVLGKTGKVLAVEQEMGPERCHPDLVIQRTEPIQGSTFDRHWLEVIDWKFSYHLKPEWVAKRLDSYESSWQLKHYAWRVQQEFSLPCTRVTVCQMAATPKPKAWKQSFEITPEALAEWEYSAQHWWAQMKYGPYPQNYEGCRKYGENHLCPMYNGCHRLHGDESKFHTLYKRREG